MAEPSKKWVMYRRTSAMGDVEFFIRTEAQWKTNKDHTNNIDLYVREIMLETDDYELAKKAMRLARGE